MNEIEKLADQITQPSVKAIANQVVTDSAHVLSHRNLLKKLTEKEDELEKVRQKINQERQGFNQQITEAEKTLQELNQKVIELSLKRGKDEEEFSELQEELEQKSIESGKEKSNLEKDLAQSLKVSQLYQEKITSLENQLVNFARRKITNQKQAASLITQLESN